MADNNMSTIWAAGLVKSVKLESCSQAEVQELPTLLIYAMVKDRVHSDTGWTELPREPPMARFRFKVPVQDLETPRQCVNFAKRCLLSAQLKFVAAETGNPKVLLKELIWNLREKWISGETCTGVIEMDVTRVTELWETRRRRIVETWVNGNAKLFEEAAEESSSSACCAICFNDFDDKSVVLELSCQRPHVFHNECIMAWLTRKSRCPLCRSPVQIRCGFWVQKKKKKRPHSESTASVMA